MTKDYFSMGLAGFAIAIGVAFIVSGYQSGKRNRARMELEKAKVERGYVLQERDLNKNGLPERFFEVDGKKYFLAVDGKNIEETLKK